MDLKRDQFETYFAESRRNRGASRKISFARLDDGTYADDHVQRHWWTWQAALVAVAGGSCIECGGPLQWRCPACRIAQSEDVADPIPDAYLFMCRKPGKMSTFASVAPEGSEGWPWDEWKTVERVALVERGPRETLWPRKDTGSVGDVPHESHCPVPGAEAEGQR